MKAIRDIQCGTYPITYIGYNQGLVTIECNPEDTPLLIPDCDAQSVLDFVNANSPRLWELF